MERARESKAKAKQHKTPSKCEQPQSVFPQMLRYQNVSEVFMSLKLWRTQQHTITSHTHTHTYKSTNLQSMVNWMRDLPSSVKSNKFGSDIPPGKRQLWLLSSSKKGCAHACRAEIRRVGSNTSSFDMRSAASGGEFGVRICVLAPCNHNSFSSKCNPTPPPQK